MARDEETQRPRINLNTASLKELMDLPMVGEQRAQFIIDARPFESEDDLEKIPGFNRGMIDDILAGGAVVGDGSRSSSRARSSSDDEDEDKRSSRRATNPDQPRDESGQFISDEEAEDEKGSSARSRGKDDDDDEGRSSRQGTRGEGQGRVKSEDDGRLKENRERGIHKGDREEEPA